MKRARQAGLFFLTAGGLYLLLVLPWPGMGRVYADAYRGVCNVVFGSLGWHSTARFEALDDPSGARDTRALISTAAGDGNIHRRAVPFHTRRTGYVPTAETLALILATPMPWRRRCWKAALGVLGISVFIALEMAVALAYSMTDVRAPIIPVAPAASSYFAELYGMLVVSPTVSLIVPVLIWILVCVPGSGLLDASATGGGVPGVPTFKERARSL